jgi:hypothetical protein
MGDAFDEGYPEDAEGPVRTVTSNRRHQRALARFEDTDTDRRRVRQRIHPRPGRGGGVEGAC